MSFICLRDPNEHTNKQDLTTHNDPMITSGKVFFCCLKLDYNISENTNLKK